MNVAASVLTVPVSREIDRLPVSACRLRLAQLALIGAMDANRELLTNEFWQNALADVNRMIHDATPAEDSNQLVLFPVQGFGGRGAVQPQRAQRAQR